MGELLLSHGESASEPLTLYNVNNGKTNNCIRIFVRHKTGAPARGSSVRLFLDDESCQMRVIDAGSGYLCQMEPVAHFGLGSKMPLSMTVEIRWPDGVTRSFDVSDNINQQITIEYPSYVPQFLAASHNNAVIGVESSSGTLSLSFSYRKYLLFLICIIKSSIIH